MERVGEGCLKVVFLYANLFSLRVLVYIPSPSKYCRRGELRRKLYVQGCSMGQRARRGVGRRNQITEREKGPFQAAGNRYVGQAERVKILKFANKLINKGL